MRTERYLPARTRKCGCVTVFDAVRGVTIEVTRCGFAQSIEDERKAS